MLYPFNYEGVFVFRIVFIIPPFKEKSNRFAHSFFAFAYNKNGKTITKTYIHHKKYLFFGVFLKEKQIFLRIFSKIDLQTVAKRKKR